MVLVLAFGLVLLVSVSLSGVAARTVLSTALLFLVAGALIGPGGGFGIVAIGPDDPIVSLLADVALFTVLFTDGQRANVAALKENWTLSGRALGFGMPLTMVESRFQRTISPGWIGRQPFSSAPYSLRRIRCSRPRWSVDPMFRCVFGGCSMSSPVSTTVWPCHSS